MSARLVLNTDVGAFNASYGAGRFAVRSADSTWFYSFQDGLNGRVLWHSHTGLREIPLDPQPTMRPVLYADPSGLYVIAGMDGDKKHILAWYIDDYRSVFTSGADPRVEALQTQVAQLAQQVTAIETALGNIGSGSAGLDTADREAVDRLKAWLGIE